MDIIYTILGAGLFIILVVFSGEFWAKKHPTTFTCMQCETEVDLKDLTPEAICTKCAETINTQHSREF